MSGLTASRSIALVAALGGLACATNPAPKGWLAPPAVAQSDQYGAWIVVTAVQSSARGDRHQPRREIAGEFLDVGHDSVFVLLSSGTVSATALADVRRARLAYYDSQSGSLAGWTFLGSVSTISNGWFAGLTFPIWLIAGSLTTASQSRAPIVSVSVNNRADWARVRMYARFPQGLPAHLPRTLPPKVEHRHP